MKQLLIFLLITMPLLAEPNTPVSFEENGLFGYKNKSGKVIIKPQYQQAMDFTKEKVSFVVHNNRWVCIDTKNNILLEAFIYDNGPDYYSENFARFIENKKIGYFDSYCKKKISASFDFAYPFENGYAKVCNGCESKLDGEHYTIFGGNNGMIDKKGKIVIPIEYDSIDSIDYKKKIAIVSKNKIKNTIHFK